MVFLFLFLSYSVSLYDYSFFRIWYQGMAPGFPAIRRSTPVWPAW
jgi:hypothetical protein